MTDFNKGVLYISINVVLIFYACAGTSTDPKEGGLFGGIHGLSSGKYEERVRQREERLDSLKKAQKNLKEEQKALEKERQDKDRIIAEQKRRLAELQNKSKALSFEVDKYQATLNQQKSQQEELRRKLWDLQNKIESLSIKSDKDLEVEQLEAERATLEKEYRLLLELYRDLSQ